MTSMKGMERTGVKAGVDDILLANDFAYYDDWEYGPMSGWSSDWEHYTLKLMRHDFGYWLILSAHSGGENKTFNVGSSNDAEQIISIRDSLAKLF